MTTPDEWLLARYDGDTGGRHAYEQRPMFQVLDDHPPDECELWSGECRHWSGDASWPNPTCGRELDAADRSAA